MPRDLPPASPRAHAPVACALAVVAGLAATVTRAGAEQQRRADAALGVVTLRAPTEGTTLVRGGSFTMGSEVTEIELALSLCRFEPGRQVCERSTDDFAAEFPPHSVTLGDYRIDRSEVTAGDYRRCVETGPCAAPPFASGGKRFEQPELPITMVSWSEASTYCKWRGGRLPTEAEWERAARGLAGRRFPWGSTYDPYIANGGRLGLDPFEDKDGYLELAPVGALPFSRTPDGIVDLAGNAEEWVADWFGAYPEGAVSDPRGPETGDEKVIRGGSYAHGRAWLRSATRGHDLPGSRRAWRGFRCAYDG